MTIPRLLTSLLMASHLCRAIKEAAVGVTVVVEEEEDDEDLIWWYQ